jgi:hypothetical protein
MSHKPGHRVGNLDELPDPTDVIINFDTSAGPPRVYVEDVPGYQAGATGTAASLTPFYENLYRAQQEGFEAIIKDPKLKRDLEFAYKIFNNKELNDDPVPPDDLKRYYDDGMLAASRRPRSDKVTGVDVLFSRLPSAESIQEMVAAQGRGGAYKGPVSTYTEMAESDVRATANDVAIELLGRPLDQDEFDRVLRKTRRAEQAQPTVTTRSTGKTVTQQGLTAQGRDDILREVISKNPEYEQFQVETTVLDAMLKFVNKKRQISDG